MLAHAGILVIFPLCVTYAIFSDLFTMTIPNRVSVILIASFALLAPLSGMDAAILAHHLLALAVVFLACFALFSAGVMGGGDAKLLAAMALWFGWNPSLLTFLVYTTLFGGVLTLVLLKMRTPAGIYVLSRIPMTHNLTDPSKGIPYGIAIGAAGLMCYPETPMMQTLIARMAAG